MKNLSELQQDMYQERQIENRIRTLEKRCNQLEDTVSDLKFAKEKEEEDVERCRAEVLRYYSIRYWENNRRCWTKSS